jgi:biopolymer transport protein ExbD
MKFPRNARISKGSLEAAPWAAIMFLLVIFLMLGGLLYTPGVHVQLPPADDLPGTDKPTITVAMDAGGRLFFQNQLIEEAQLRSRLAELVKTSPEKLALVVQADKGTSYENLVRLTQLARAAGIESAVLATLPGPFRKTTANPGKP